MSSARLTVWLLPCRSAVWQPLEIEHFSRYTIAVIPTDISQLMLREGGSVGAVVQFPADQGSPGLWHFLNSPTMLETSEGGRSDRVGDATSKLVRIDRLRTHCWNIISHTGNWSQVSELRSNCTESCWYRLQCWKGILLPPVLCLINDCMLKTRKK